jgi:hypothetical protein
MWVVRAGDITNMIPPQPQNRIASPQLKPGQKYCGQARRTTSQPNPKRKSRSGVPLMRPVIAPRLTNPVLPMPRLPRNRFYRIEELIMEGMDYLGQNPPDLPDAAKCLAAAERDPVTPDLPEKLCCRMRFFRESLERIRKELLHECIDRELKEIRPLLKLKPPCIDRAGEELQAAAVLLKEAPDAQLERELENLRQEILTVEKKSQRGSRAGNWSLAFVPKIPRSLQTASLLFLGGGMLVAATLWTGSHFKKAADPSSNAISSAVQSQTANASASEETLSSVLPTPTPDSNASLSLVADKTPEPQTPSPAAPEPEPVKQATFLPASLRLKVQPQDATFSIVYPERRPVACGNAECIQGLEPNAEFKLITQLAKYVALTNSFTLKPGEVRSWCWRCRNNSNYAWSGTARRTISG